MHKAIAATAISLALTSAALAHGEEHKSAREKAVDYRQSVMTLIGANFKPMGAMVKGDIPFDAAAFARYAKDMDAVAHLDVLRGFPEDSEGEGSDAKGEIWLDWADFKSKLGDMQTESAKLAKVAAEGDQGAIKAQFSDTAKACKSCHKQYKQ